MKNILNKLTLILTLLPMLAGCEKDKDLIVVEPVENYKQLYGLGTIFSWDSNVPTELALTDPNTFTIDRVIKYSEENKQFKFCLEKGDWDKVRYLVPPTTDDGTAVRVIAPGEHPMLMCSEMTGDLRDQFWGIPEGTDGTYRITVNVKTLTLTLEKLSDEVEEPEPEVETIYGLGSAFGWDSGNPTGLTPDPLYANVYKTEVNLIYSEENKQFKFCLEKGDWDKVHYLVPESVDYNENVKIITSGEYPMFQCSEMESTLRDHFWGIPEGTDGKYNLTVNTETMTLKVEKIVKTIYGLGNAFGWDSGNPTGLIPDPEQAGIYTAEVDLAYSEENKQFKFCLEKGEWNEIHYLVPESVDYNENVKIAAPGEYPMFQCSEMEGTLRDHFWGIPEGADGKYRLTVNTNTMTLKVEKAN